MIDLLTEGPSFEIAVARAETIAELAELVGDAIEGTRDRSITRRYIFGVLQRAEEIGAKRE